MSFIRVLEGHLVIQEPTPNKKADQETTLSQNNVKVRGISEGNLVGEGTARLLAWIARC